MPIFAVVLIVLVIVGLAALVADTARTATRVGGYPPVDLTHRAYAV